MAVVDRISEDKLESHCQVGDSTVTLRLLIEGYVNRQQHHFRQISSGT